MGSCGLPPGDLAGATAGVQAVVEAREGGGHPCDAALLLHLATLRARFPPPPVAESAKPPLLGSGTRFACLLPECITRTGGMGACCRARLQREGTSAPNVSLPACQPPPACFWNLS